VVIQRSTTSSTPRAILCAILRKSLTACLSTHRIAKLVDGEQGWTHLAAAVLALVTGWINTYPMMYKHMIMRTTSGNLRANMMIYKQSGVDASKSGYVLLETQGPVGSYNRANRSLTHFVENSIPVALLIALSGAVFPFPTFVCTVVFAVGRVLHQTAYAAIGYGPHGLGFAMSDTAKGIMMSFCLIAADKSLGLGMFEYGFAMAAKADAKASAAMGADHPWVLDAANGYVDAGVAYAATSFDAAKAYYAAAA
jgi:uncharacterized membrane protein YecN with MAPEG domain|tara:strand:- start:313 stop:1071 length:759 start_codon:yes stop_codon:yes gene_type:complete